MHSRTILAIAVILLLAATSAWSALPGSSLPAQPVGFQFDVYPTANNTPNGTFVAATPALNLPQPVIPGNVVILNNVGQSTTNPSNWNNVVLFPANASGNATTLQMFSSTGSGIQDQTAVNSVLTGTSNFFVGESQSGLIDYQAGLNTYRFHTVPVPDASALVLLLAGAGPALGYHFLRRRSAC